FWLVLLTHLANVGLLFAVVRRVTGSGELGCFVAALFGIAPADEGALGWYSVYGQVALGTVVLVLLGSVLGRFEVSAPLRMAESLRWIGLLVVASTMFGMGIGIALVFPLVVLLLFPGSRTPTGVRVLFLSFPGALVAAYWALHHLYSLAYGSPAEADLIKWLGIAIV